MRVELFDEAGRVIVSKRVRNRLPVKVEMPKTTDGLGVAVSAMCLKGNLSVNGEPVREYREDFQTPILMSKDDSITFGNQPITT